MIHPNYKSAQLEVRADLVAAHQRAWRRLAQPGTWWSGAERVAIAAEARNASNCRFCRSSRSAVGSKMHESLGRLSGSALEVVHRVVTAPQRLSRDWYEGIAADGLGDSHYVELVGVVATVTAVDTFARAVGAETAPLPSPAGGRPARSRPSAARDEGAWVAMIAVENAKGVLRDLYKEGAFVPNLQRALSLVPDEARGLADLLAAHYVAFEQLLDRGVELALSRPQMELIATYVSTLHQCFY